MTISEIQLLISLLPIGYVAGMAIPVGLADWRYKRVPNKIVLPLTALTLLCWLTLAVWQGKWAELGLSVLLGFLILVIGSFASIKLDLIGMGDVKLIVTLTMIITWFSVFAGLLFLPIIIVLSIFALGIAFLLYALGLIELNGSMPIYPCIMVSFAGIMIYLLS